MKPDVYPGSEPESDFTGWIERDYGEGAKQHLLYAKGVRVGVINESQHAIQASFVHEIDGVITEEYGLDYIRSETIDSNGNAVVQRISTYPNVQQAKDDLQVVCQLPENQN